MGISLTECGDLIVASFGPEAIDQMEWAAGVRSDGSRANGHKDMRRAPVRYSNMDLDRMGWQGEAAWAAYLGLRVRVSPTKDPGIDFIIATGETVDAKGAFKKDSPLNFARPCRADIGVLAVRAEPQDPTKVVLVGWKTHPKSRTSQSRLLPPAELLERHLAARDG